MRRQIEFVEDPEKAEIVVFGFSKDIRDQLSTWDELRRRRPATRFLVLSEEPLWDTLWSGDFTQRQTRIADDSGFCEFTVLNHVTSPVFRFERCPYFVTTSDHFFIRYQNLFARNAALSASDIVSIWRDARVRQAYFAEKRLSSSYEFERTDLDIVGLSTYRTEVALAAEGEGILRVGQGWSAAPRRQALPDWHLDKIAHLDQSAFIVSAIENTHHRDYVTEKVFDAFAVLGVPLYFASREHAIHKLVAPDSFINLYGLSSTEAAKVVADFSPSRAFLTAYMDTQRLLAELFANPAHLLAERQREVSSVLRELEAVVG